jgi:outer membrane protein OmpA-like peptidoglycan-associated protein
MMNSPLISFAGIAIAVAAAHIAAPCSARAQSAPELSVTYMLVKPAMKNGIRDYSQPDTVLCHMKDGIPVGDIAHRGIEIRRKDRIVTVPVTAGSAIAVVIPHGFGWDANGTSGITDPAPYTVQYVVIGTDGVEHRSVAVNVPVRVPDSKYERRTLAAATRVDRYSLCLFKFDRAELGALNDRIVRELIVPDIGKDAQIEVIGHMDIVGQPEHNMKLSENRARTVVSALHADVPAGGYRSLEGRGVGEGEPLFTNALPEGRFYNRATQVIVYTPTFRE